MSQTFLPSFSLEKNLLLKVTRKHPWHIPEGGNTLEIWALWRRSQAASCRETLLKEMGRRPCRLFLNPLIWPSRARDKTIRDNWLCLLGFRCLNQNTNQLGFQRPEQYLLLVNAPTSPSQGLARSLKATHLDVRWAIHYILKDWFMRS